MRLLQLCGATLSHYEAQAPTLLRCSHPSGPATRAKPKPLQTKSRAACAHCSTAVLFAAAEPSDRPQLLIYMSQFRRWNARLLQLCGAALLLGAHFAAFKPEAQLQNSI